MPFIDPRPFGGPSYSSGVYGNPSNPLEWQHQPGDHSDTGILPLLTPVSGTGGVAFGFLTAGTATHTVAAETTFCDYDFADDTYDNAADTYDCAALADTTGGSLPIVRLRPQARPPSDDEDATVLLVAALRSRLRL